jgi:hypothetical protein
MPTLHICLISAQLLPNLIPLLANPPEAVQLVVTPTMKNSQAPRFKKILKQKNISIIDPDHECLDTGLNLILEQALELAAKLESQYPGRRLVLNATGGTKLMALAFVEVFRDLAHAEIIYTDTEHGRIEYLDKRRQAPTALDNCLDVPTYLAANGFTLRDCESDRTEWRENADVRKPLSKWLAGESADLGDFLGALNRLANAALDDAGENLRCPNQAFDRAPRGRWRNAMVEISRADYGLIAWDNGTQITFRTAEAARYLGGIWLEEYVWHIVHDARIYDVRCSVAGTWEGGNKQDQPRNEFDLVATHRNRLLLVECKTLRFGRDAHKDQDILYKLDALGSKAKGLFGTTWLISARALTDAARSRAKSQRIEIIEAGALTRLREKVLAWMGAL